MSFLTAVTFTPDEKEMQILQSEHQYNESLARKNKTQSLLYTSEEMLGKYKNLYNKIEYIIIQVDIRAKHNI